MSIKCGLTGDYINAGHGRCPNDAVYVMSGANVFGLCPVCEAHKQVLDYQRFICDRILYDGAVVDDRASLRSASPRFLPIPVHTCQHFDQNDKCYTCGASR